MVAVTELATEVGTRAACHALCVPRGPYYPGSTDSLCSDAHHSAAFTGTRPGSGGTHGGSGPSPWRTLSGSLAGRGLRDLAR